MIHFVISFGYVAAAAAGAIFLPHMVGWLRPDIAIIGGITAALTAANIHFYISQSERIRRLHTANEWMSRRASLLEAEVNSLAKSVVASTTARREDAAENERRVTQTVADIQGLHDLLVHFIEDRSAKPAVDTRARGAKAELQELPPRRSTTAHRTSKYSEPEEFSLTERKH